MVSTAAAPPASRAEIDRRHLFHPFTALATHQQSGPPAVLVKGEGVWLEDDRGRRYIDAMAGLWCVNVGYGRREIAEALQRQATELSFCHAFSGLSSDKPVAPRIVKAAFARGAIGRALPSADTIAFSPPFVISESAKSIRR